MDATSTGTERFSIVFRSQPKKRGLSESSFDTVIYKSVLDTFACGALETVTLCFETARKYIEIH